MFCYVHICVFGEFSASFLTASLLTEVVVYAYN